MRTRESLAKRAQDLAERAPSSPDLRLILPPFDTVSRVPRRLYALTTVSPET